MQNYTSSEWATLKSRPLQLPCVISSVCCTSRVGASVNWQILGDPPQDFLLGLPPVFTLQQLLVRVRQVELCRAEERQIKLLFNKSWQILPDKRVRIRKRLFHLFGSWRPCRKTGGGATQSSSITFKHGGDLWWNGRNREFKQHSMQKTHWCDPKLKESIRPLSVSMWI